MSFSGLLKKKSGKFLSIDLSRDNSVSIAYVEFLGQGLKLLNYDIKELSSEDKEEEVRAVIREFLKQNSIFDTETRLTIPDANIYIKNLVLPKLPKNEILEAIKWQVKEDAVLDLGNAVFDRQFIKEWTDAEGAKKNELMFVAADKAFINGYINILTACNLKPVYVSINPFNYSALLKQVNTNIQVKAIADIGDNDTALYIYSADKFNFVRRLPFSFKRLINSLTGTLVSEKGKVSLSYEEAKEVIADMGIPQEEPVISKNISGVQAISLMRPLLEGFVREIKASFDYFALNKNEDKPSAFYISGRGADVKNLDRYLKKELAIDTNNLPLPLGLSIEAVEKERLNKSQNRISGALSSLLLKPGEAVNLLPQEIKTEKIEFIEAMAVRMASFVITLVLLFSLFFVKFQISDYKTRLKNANMHLKIIKEIESLKQRVNSREELVAKIQKDYIPVDGLLKLISNLSPANIILDELSFDGNSRVLVLKGVVSVDEEISGPMLTSFMEKLEATSFIEEAGLVFSNRLAVGQAFEIKCDIAK